MVDSVLKRLARTIPKNQELAGMASNPRAGIEELRQLSNLIATAVDKIDTVLTQNGLDFPSLRTPFSPPSEAGRAVPEIQEAAATVAAAAQQLVATVRSPPIFLLTSAISFNLSAALNVAEEAHVAEIIRESGDKGLHVTEIAAPTGISPAKLSRVLRLLVTFNIFTEVAPDVFAHNRISSLLDTGKAAGDILKDTTKKHENTLGIAAAVGHVTDECMKTLSFLAENLLDPVSGHTDDIHDLAFNRAFSTKSTVWEYYDQGDQAYRRARFGMAMEGSKHAAPPLAIVDGMPWKELGEGALVVDVGGGVGAQSLTLSKHCPNLKFILQDRKLVIEEAEKFWKEENPNALKTGRMQMQAHDFFTTQPIKNADVFLIRMVLHDYPDKNCVEILRHLREAAKPSTKLVIVDSIVSYACEEPASNHIPGASERPKPPTPLLGNFGAMNSITYLMDVQMMGITGGVERTLSQAQELLALAGWKIERVHHGVPFVVGSQKIIAVPV